MLKNRLRQKIFVGYVKPIVYYNLFNLCTINGNQNIIEIQNNLTTIKDKLIQNKKKNQELNKIQTNEEKIHDSAMIAMVALGSLTSVIIFGIVYFA